MKLLNLIVFLTFCNVIIGQMNLPDGIKFNPLNIPDKSINEIIQYKVIYPSNDTTIEYIFSYNVNYYSLKSDFQKEKYGRIYNKLKYPLGYCCMNDSLNLYWRDKNNSYNYIETRYFLDKDRCLTDSVLVIQPNRFMGTGVLDGVYIKEFKDTIVKAVKTTTYNNQLLFKEIYYNDSLYSKTEYSYGKYWYQFLNDSTEYFLLTKIMYKQFKFFEFDKIETIIEYKFKH